MNPQTHTPAQPYNVFLKPLRRNRSTSLIYIPPEVRERSQFALVISVGESVTSLSPGEIVIADLDHGRPIDNPDDPDNPYRDMPIEHILAIISTEGDPQ